MGVIQGKGAALFPCPQLTTANRPKQRRHHLRLKCCGGGYFLGNGNPKRRPFLVTVGASLPHTPSVAAAAASDESPATATSELSYSQNPGNARIECLLPVTPSRLATSRARGNFNKALAKTASLIKKTVREHGYEPPWDVEASSSDEENNHRVPDEGEKEWSYVSPTDDVRTRSREVPVGSASHLRGWGNGGSSCRLRPKLTNHPEGTHRFSAESTFFSRNSFRDIGCSEFMIESLKGQRISQPSHIQAMAFPHVIERKTCVIADQSGSGKTLAYLVPIIQRLRLEELKGVGGSQASSPRVLIMVPTAELASQVLSICRSMSKYGIPFRSMVVTGGHRQKTQLENLEKGVDVLIATPGRFIFLINEGFLKLTNLSCAVLDEVDILFKDEDFEVALNSLINSSPLNTQYLFVTATLPVDVYNNLIEAFPDCKMIMGPGIHRTSTGLEEVLVDCSGEQSAEKTPETAFMNKKSALLQLVEQRPVSKTIVFCNKIETCRKVENILKRFDRKGNRVQVLPFHAAVAQDSRLENMKEFMNSPTEEISLFLVCTDRASRGIDFAGVNHVVLFDFPRDPSEYVRRVGRTARGAGGKGKAFIFVVGKQVSLARKIIDRNQKGHPLHEVPSAYELMR